MTSLDKLVPFVMQNWPLVLLACVMATVTCFMLRRSRWIIALWLPLFLLAAAYTVFFFSIFFTSRGPHQPDDGYLGMALMFQALLSLPIFATTILLFFARPPRGAWRSPFLFLGLILTGIAPVLLRTAFAATQRSVSFYVTDNNGTSFRRVGFTLIGDRSPAAFTDETGRLVRRIEQGYALQGEFMTDGYLPHSVSVDVTGTRFYVHHSVPKPNARREWLTTDDFLPLSRSVEIPVVMQPAPTQ